MLDQSVLGPLRVGVPIPTEPPTVGGGFEFQQTVFAEIRRRLASMEGRHALRFIPIATEPQSAERWQIDPQHVLSIVPPSVLGIRSALQRKLRRLLSPWEPLLWRQSPTDRAATQVLHANVDVLWSLNSKTITDQIPFVLTVWDLQHRLQPFFPEVSRSGQWESRQAHHAHVARKAFLCVSGTQRGADELQLFYGIDPSRLLVNPFPCPPAIPAPVLVQRQLLEAMELQSGQFLLYPAHFWPHKNHLAALLALRKLVDQGHSLKLVLTGSDRGAMAAVQEIVAELDLSDCVVQAGFVDRNSLAALYSASLALLYPSFFGPDNIPPLESMSYGTPALVADVPGAQEQYGDAVLRFDPNQPDQIVAAVLRLINDSALRDRLILNGQKLITRLTPAAYVDRIETALAASAMPLRCSILAR